MKYTVKLLVRPNGERLVVVLEDGLIDFDGCAYATSIVRTKSGSHNTVITKLRGVVSLLNFCDRNGIDLQSRVRTGKLLKPWEWRDFAAESGQGVTAGTQAMGLGHAIHFLAWLARCEVARIEESAAAECYRSHAREVLRACDEAIPRVIAPPRRDGLNTPQRKLLASIINDADALRALWPDAFARVRNRLLLAWLLLLGHRIGELLAILLADIDASAERPTCTIVRRHDNPNDPRPAQPVVKGVGRTLSIPKPLRPIVDEYLPARAAIPVTHGFLLVASATGAPLSRSAVTKVFARLGRVYPALRGITAHMLRHTWVSTFRNVAARMQVREEDLSWIEARAMGWRDEKSDRFYGHAQRAQVADEISLRMQSIILGEENGESRHDEVA